MTAKRRRLRTSLRASNARAAAGPKRSQPSNCVQKQHQQQTLGSIFRPLCLDDGHDAMRRRRRSFRSARAPRKKLPARAKPRFAAVALCKCNCSALPMPLMCELSVYVRARARECWLRETMRGPAPDRCRSRRLR